MILTCPSCGTRYQCDSAQFAPPGRNVRCAKCAHVWFQSAAAPEPEVIVDREPEPEPTVQPEAPAIPAPQPADTNVATLAETRPVRRPARRRSSSTAAQAVSWAALVFLAVFVGWATVQFRQPIADLWPQTAALYDALG